MNYIFIGKIVNTHGIKGEVRLISNFERKDLVFKKDFNLYVGNEKKKLVIDNYRIHKNFDMLTFRDLNNINLVLEYKGQDVYILRDDLSCDIKLKSDLLNYNVIYNNKVIGQVSNFFNNKVYDIMIVSNDKNEYLVPYLDNFIERIDYEHQTIYIINMKGLIE